MYRAGQGALDLQIAQTVAAIGAAEHWASVDTHLRGEVIRIEARLEQLRSPPSGETRLSLSRLWSLLRRSEYTEIEYSIHQADQIILRVALETELKFIESQQNKVSQERKSVVGADKHLSELLVQKEAQIVGTDSPQKATILEIARVRGNWQALNDCLSTTSAVAHDAQSELLQATAYFEDAHDSSSRGRAGGFESGSKEGQLQQASVHAGMADIHLRTLEVELATIEVRGKPLPIELEKILKPVSTNPFDGQVISYEDLQSEATRISDLISALLPVQRRCQQELLTLESKRRQVLGDLR